MRAVEIIRLYRVENRARLGRCIKTMVSHINSKERFQRQIRFDIALGLAPIVLVVVRRRMIRFLMEVSAMLTRFWNQLEPTMSHGFGEHMSIFAWMVLGLAAGFLGSKIVNRHGEGVIVDILLGIVGAVAGGFLFQSAGIKGITGFNLWSLLVATTGAIVLLIAYHAVRGAGSSAR